MEKDLDLIATGKMDSVECLTTLYNRLIESKNKIVSEISFEKTPVEELEHMPHESCIQHYNGIKWLGIKPYDYVHGWWYYKSDEPANYILRNYTIKIK